jgi:hypothetical protein
LQAAVEPILTRYGVKERLNLSYTTHLTERPLRRYGSRPAGMEADPRVSVNGEINEAALTAATGKLGWRVYATHTP